MNANQFVPSNRPKKTDLPSFGLHGSNNFGGPNRKSLNNIYNKGNSLNVLNFEKKEENQNRSQHHSPDQFFQVIRHKSNDLGKQVSDLAKELEQIRMKAKYNSQSYKLENDRKNKEKQRQIELKKQQEEEDRKLELEIAKIDSRISNYIDLDDQKPAYGNHSLQIKSKTVQEAQQPEENVNIKEKIQEKVLEQKVMQEEQGLRPVMHKNLEIIQEENKSSIQSNSIKVSPSGIHLGVQQSQGQLGRILIDSSTLKQNDAILFPSINQYVGRQEIEGNGSLDSDQDAESNSISASESLEKASSESDDEVEQQIVQKQQDSSKKDQEQTGSQNSAQYQQLDIPVLKQKSKESDDIILRAKSPEPQANNQEQQIQFKRVNRFQSGQIPGHNEQREEIHNMRLAISDLKKRCKSVQGRTRVINGRKIHKVLYCIKERDENIVQEQNDGRSVSPIIGDANHSEIKKVFSNCHKNLKEMKIGAHSNSSFILSEQKLVSNVGKIVDRVRRQSGQVSYVDH